MINNQPDPSHWKYMRKLELWEAVALICDFEPRKIRVERALGGNEPIGFSFYAPDVQDLFYSMLNIAKNHICDFQPQPRSSLIRLGIEYRYQIQVSLIAFVNWAKPIIEEKGHKVPNWLLKLESKKNNIASNQQTINKETADKINIDEITTSPLTLQQLLKRPFWNQYTPDNIYELANKGRLGLYYKISNADRCLERKTYHPISQNIRSLLNQKWLQDPANNAMLNECLQLKNKFIKFIQDHKLLLKHKIGYVRLATATEVEISPLCAQSSVDCFLEKSGIDSQEWNNYFGFVFLRPDNQKQKKRIISPAYYFQQRMIQKDLVVFIDQIEAFEQQIITQHQKKDILANKTFMSAHGIKMADKAHENNRKTKEEILIAYNKGQPWKSIAEASKVLGKKFNKSPRTVAKYIYALNKAIKT